MDPPPLPTPPPLSQELLKSLLTVVLSSNSGGGEGVGVSRTTSRPEPYIHTEKKMLDIS